MSKEFYTNITDSVRRIRHGVRLLCILDRLITFVCAAAYGLLLIYDFFNAEGELPSAVLVPAIGFIVLTIVRAKINAKRPYEVFDFSPIIPKETVGHSFPSRHVFSIFVIGCTYYRVDASVGLTLFLLGAILATLRVFGGVHFIRDVVTGAFGGIIYSVLAFSIAHIVAANGVI